MRKVGLLLAVAALAPAGTASASTISGGSTVTYTAAPGEANKVLVSVLDAGTLSVWDSGARITSASGGCEVVSSDPFAGDTAHCPLPSAVVADLGDRDDSYWDWDGPSTVDAGHGNDNPLFGKGGDDVIRGGIGSDLLYGQEGDDTLDGGPGDDYLEGVPCWCEDEAITHGADTYIGGGGSDSVTYEGRSENLALSPDGVANDGASGEGDNIGPDVLSIVGGHGADILTGNAARNALAGGEGDDALTGGGGDDNLGGGTGNDRLTGNAGQDTLGGDDGDDVLDGGEGVDRYWGDQIGACIAYSCASGQDVIEARDGAQEQVSCGPGTDTLKADANEIVENSVDLSDQCESVAGLSAAPAATFKVVSAKSDRRRRITVRVNVPGPGKVTVRAAGLRAARTASAAGDVKLRLKSSRRARLRLRITFAPVSGASVTLSRTVRLRG
jgi:RTX calcium-binding nonapeptide repeat (4 copies)